MAADKKGRLPNNILAKASNANKLDGLDSEQRRVRADGGTADTIPTINGCRETDVFSYPLTITKPGSTGATSATATSRRSRSMRRLG